MGNANAGGVTAGAITADETGGVDQRSARNYRPDIDGLRALAVLPIVAFHLGIQGIGGGYVGVDIFFVISGYLIGGILLRQIHDRRYSITDFYARRFRRIVPALALVLFATTVAAALILLPKALIDYGYSLGSTTLFGSNIYLWKTADYFGKVGDTIPLLHTWSLAVEEQYYIVFPFILLAIRRFDRRTIYWILAALAVVSILVSIKAGRSDPVGNFYLLPTRLWELLLGVLAVETRAAWLDRKAWREALSAVAAAMILGAIFLYTEDTPFPGITAIPPCLGTAILLVTGAQGGSAVGRVLAIRPLIFFGLISYSLYLWHWPIIVLTKQYELVAALTPVLQLFAFALSVALAWLSWRLVERPWRNPAVPSRAIWIGTGLSGLVMCGLAAALVLSAGLPGRFNERALRLASIQDDATTNEFREGSCFITLRYKFVNYDKAKCLKQDPARTNVLLFGDSHAAHLWVGLQQHFPQLNVLQATASGCKPLVHRGRAAARCEQMMKFVFDDYLQTKPVRWIVLGGYWLAEDETGVGETIDWLKARGFNVILAGPVVRYQLALPQIMAIAEQRGDQSLMAKSRVPGLAELDTAYRKLAAQHGVPYFSPYAALCKRGECQVLDGHDMPIQFDYGHLTTVGSNIVAGDFPIEVLGAPAH